MAGRLQPQASSLEPGPRLPAWPRSLALRMNEGASKVAVTAECTRHGRWSSAQAITVVEGEGGCADAPRSDDNKDAMIRAIALVSGCCFR